MPWCCADLLRIKTNCNFKRAKRAIFNLYIPKSRPHLKISKKNSVPSVTKEFSQKNSQILKVGFFRQIATFVLISLSNQRIFTLLVIFGFPNRSLRSRISDVYQKRVDGNYFFRTEEALARYCSTVDFTCLQQWSIEVDFPVGLREVTKFPKDIKSN